MSALSDKCDDFVHTLNSLFDALLDDPPTIGVNLVEDKGIGVIGPEPFPNHYPSDLPLLRSCDTDAALHLRMRYSVELDKAQEHIQVISSTFGLWVDVGLGKTRPIVRVEYDRTETQRDVAAAHVHLHANSPELAWVWGSCGNAAKNLHELHFPVGGRRFRPSIEEFLLFLDREDLFTDWKIGWKPRLLDSLDHWERLQARATVRAFSTEAADALVALGYTVTPPTP